MGNYFSSCFIDQNKLAQLRKDNYIKEAQLNKANQELKKYTEKHNYVIASPPQRTAKIFQFNWDMTAPNINNIRMKGKEIIMTGVQDGYRIFSQQPLPETGVHKITFRVNRLLMTYKTIKGTSFGIITEKLKRQNNHQDSQIGTAYYLSVNGRGSLCRISGVSLSEDQSQYKMILGIGDRLQMKINMDDKEINFIKYNNSQQKPCITISNIPFPVPFLDTPIYVFVKLSNLTDTVEVL